MAWGKGGSDSHRRHRPQRLKRWSSRPCTGLARRWRIRRDDSRVNVGAVTSGTGPVSARRTGPRDRAVQGVETTRTRRTSVRHAVSAGPSPASARGGGPRAPFDLGYGASGVARRATMRKRANSGALDAEGGIAPARRSLERTVGNVEGQAMWQLKVASAAEAVVNTTAYVSCGGRASPSRGNATNTTAGLASAVPAITKPGAAWRTVAAATRGMCLTAGGAVGATGTIGRETVSGTTIPVRTARGTRCAHVVTCITKRGTVTAIAGMRCGARGAEGRAIRSSLVDTAASGVARGHATAAFRGAASAGRLCPSRLGGRPGGKPRMGIRTETGGTRHKWGRATPVARMGA